MFDCAILTKVRMKTFTLISDAASVASCSKDDAENEREEDKGKRAVFGARKGVRSTSPVVLRQAFEIGEKDGNPTLAQTAPPITVSCSFPLDEFEPDPVEIDACFELWASWPSEVMNRSDEDRSPWWPLGSASDTVAQMEETHWTADALIHAKY